MFLATLAGGHEPVLGLDLQGGVSVVLSPVGKYKSDSLDVAIDIIRNRVDSFGIIEPRDLPPGQRHRHRPARREGPREGGSRSSARPPSCASGPVLTQLPSEAAQAKAATTTTTTTPRGLPPRRRRPRRAPQRRRPPSRRATTPPCRDAHRRSPRRHAPPTSATRVSCCRTSPAGRTRPATTSARPGSPARRVAPRRPSSSPGRLDGQHEPHRLGQRPVGRPRASSSSTSRSRSCSTASCSRRRPSSPTRTPSPRSAAGADLGQLHQPRPPTSPSSSTTARCLCTLKQVNVENVSPTLGNDQLHAGIIAGHHRPRARRASTCSSSTGCSASW